MRAVVAVAAVAVVAATIGGAYLYARRRAAGVRPEDQARDDVPGGPRDQRAKLGAILAGGAGAAAGGLTLGALAAPFDVLAPGVAPYAALIGATYGGALSAPAGVAGGWFG